MVFEGMWGRMEEGKGRKEGREGRKRGRKMILRKED